MAGVVLEQVALLIHFEVLGPQRDPLIQPHVAADNRRLANDDTCSMIDKKALADFGTGVHIYTGLGVRDLRDDARKHRDTEQIELVSKAVADNRGDPRIAEEHFVNALGRWIALISGSDIRVEKRSYLWQPHTKFARNFLGPLLLIEATGFLRVIRELELPSDLLAKRLQRPIELIHDESVGAFGG
jgi:hypothetical protein